ncbi:MAG: glycosyltransferase family 9 protein [Bdellovibrionales bacterium CG10_big_fil_rev_8_21_14_0_10_45_34]|nr:MAG: glycosyltransferase family 9 protein [Bdellovibrionales bacterium CG10_big_fil_rev_8_21_14_0_10_45_34]
MSHDDGSSMKRDLNRNKLKLALIRLDRLGDLILTLPADEILPASKCDVTWVVPAAFSGLFQLTEPDRSFHPINLADPKQAKAELLNWLKKKQFDAVVFFQGPTWVYSALFKSRIPIRVGVKSRWQSWLCLNAGLRQKRSLSEQHESCYSDELVKHLAEKIGVVPQNRPFNWLRLKRPVGEGSRDRHREMQVSRKYIVVHPGMGGSARNWPASSYIQLIEKLIENGLVVITGTAADERWLEPIRVWLEMQNDSKKTRIYWSVGKVDLLGLAEVLSQAKALVAPSTGVLHLAASMGTPTVGIFSPVRVQAPTRWGARGARVKNLSPQVDCPGHFDCLMEKCSQFDCMSQISVGTVMKEIDEVINLS